MLYDHEWNNCRQPEHQTPRPNPSIVCQGDLKRPREHFWTSVRTDLRPVPTAPHPWEPEVCLLLQCLWIALSWKTGCYNPVYLRVWRFSSWCFPEDSVHAPCWQFSLLPSCSAWDRTRLSEAGSLTLQGGWCAGCPGSLGSDGCGPSPDSMGFEAEWTLVQLPCVPQMGLRSSRQRKRDG